MRQLVRLYYLATPGFFLADWLWGVNIRVAFLDQFPTGRYAYYGLCCLLGLAAWRRPDLAGLTGLAESGANIVLLILSVNLWYWGALEAAGSDSGAAPTIGAQELTNFVLSAVMAGVSYTLQRSRVA